MSMLVIPPVDITTARLTSSSVPETPPAAYAGGATYGLGDTVSVNGSAGLRSVYRSLQAGNIGHDPATSPAWWKLIGITYQVYGSGTAYALGDRVIDTTAHMIYESLVASNTGNLLTDKTKWYAVGPTNRYAAFNVYYDTATEAPDGVLKFTITAGARIDATGFEIVRGRYLNVRQTVAGVETYNQTEDLSTRQTYSWSSYFQGDFRTKNIISFFDVPAWANGVIEVTLTATSGAASMKTCLMGRQVDIGDVAAGAVSDVINYSTVERPAGGPKKLNSIPNVPKNIQNILLEKMYAKRAYDLRDQLPGRPAFWSGLQDNGDGFYELIQLVGFYTTFSINMAHPKHAIINLEVQEI